MKVYICICFVVNLNLSLRMINDGLLGFKRCISCDSGFGGLGVACWLLVPKFAGSNRAEAVGFLGRKKSSARLPSEEK